MLKTGVLFKNKTTRTEEVRNIQLKEHCEKESTGMKFSSFIQSMSKCPAPRIAVHK